MTFLAATRSSLRGAALLVAGLSGVPACGGEEHGVAPPPSTAVPAEPPATSNPPLAPPEPPPPTSLTDPSSELRPAPRPQGPSCNEPELGQCTEYPPGHRAAEPRGRCATALGYWRETACAREGALGLCLIDHGPEAGAVRVVTMPTYGARVCRIAGGRFGEFVGDRLRVDAPPPSYELAVASGWTAAPPWLPLQTADLTNVVFLRAEPQSDGTQPSLSIQRRALPAGATLASVVEDRRAALGADAQTTVVSTEEMTLGDRPASEISIRVEDHQRIRPDLGGNHALVQAATYEAREVITVIDGQSWTLVCGGSEPTSRGWRRACEAMIASWRVTPSPEGTPSP